MIKCVLMHQRSSVAFSWPQSDVIAFCSISKWCLYSVRPNAKEYVPCDSLACVFIKTLDLSHSGGHGYCSTCLRVCMYVCTYVRMYVCICMNVRTVIDIHFFSIRSLTFYFSIPIISIRFWRTAVIEYFHIFHTIFVARILRFSQCKNNEGFLNTFWLHTWVSLQNSY